MIWVEPYGDFMRSQGWVSVRFGIIAKFGQFRNEKGVRIESFGSPVGGISESRHIVQTERKPKTLDLISVSS